MEVRPWDLFKTSVTSLVDRKGQLLRMLALPTMLAIVSMVAGVWNLHQLLSAATPEQIKKIAEQNWWDGPLDLIVTLLCLMAAVSWCRHVLGAESEAAIYRTDFRRMARVLWALLKAYFFAAWPFMLSVGGLAATNALSVPAPYSSILNAIFGGAAIGTLIFALVASMRLVVVLPMASMDERVHVRILFRERKGMGWPTFAAALIAGAFIFIFSIFIQSFGLAVLKTQPSLMTLLVLGSVGALVNAAASLFNLSLWIESHKAWRAKQAAAG